jgi:spore coat polysaccharide biosynthesis predicted glycosyltransferase SpsG
MIAVIADGGAQAGLGHIARCSAIAVALRARGLTVTPQAYGAEDPITLDGIEWRPYDGAPPAGGVVLLDTYTMPWDDRLAFAERHALAVIHDEGGVIPGARLVVSVGGGVNGRHVLAGLRFAPLRPPFWGLPELLVHERVRRVLVTTGGGALQDAGVELAHSLAAALPQTSVALVRGPYARFEPPPDVRLVDAPPSLLEELLAADMVVTAAGQTALEAVATATPTIALPLAANQRANADPLAAAGAALVVEPGEDVTAAAVGLAADHARRLALARAGQAAVDGFGALRIAFRLAEL